MATSLEEIIASLGSLPQDQFDAIAKKTLEARVANGGEKWIPTVGPQSDAYYSKADVLLFGGSPGGGKSSLGLGLAFTQHKRSLIMRRQYTDLGGLIDDAIKINGSKNGFNGSPPPRLTIEKERFIDFGACTRVGDEQHWMGRPHDLICVGKGTLVLMADGAKIPIENITVGDFVMTLEGGKKVTKVLPIKHGNAVRVTTPFGSQIQSCAHSILTTAGWESHDTSYGSFPFSILVSTVSRYLHRFFVPFSKTPSRISPCHNKTCLNFGHTLLQYLLPPGLLGQPAYAAYAGRLNQETISSASCGLHADILRLALLSFLQEQKQPSLKSILHHETLPPFSSRDNDDDLEASLPEGSRQNYLFGARLYDERTRLLIHRGFESMGVQLSFRQQVGAGQPNPNDCSYGYAGNIPKHTRHKGMYSHPYTKDKRQTEAILSECLFSSEPVGKVDLYDIEVDGANHYISSSGIINKNCFDEATQFVFHQIRFLMGWLRHENPNQRTRILLPTNPPLSADGVWVNEMFAPWLDDRFPYPAMPGELRYVVTDEKGNDKWVDGPDKVKIGDRWVDPTTRSFIPSEVEDNPWYAAGSYRSRLDAMAEPHRSILLGKFKTSFKDQPNQIMPTAWVKEAMHRWTNRPPENVPMCCISVDCSGGGDDPMVIARRYDGWYDELIETQGSDIPMDRSGAYCGGMVLSYRKDAALVVVDLGGGYGGPTYEHLKSNQVEVIGFKGAEGTKRRSREGKHRFPNKRSAAHWLFREALDPGQPGGSPIMLPDDPKILVDLTATTFEPVPSGIKAEPKEQVKDRIGRSTDSGDAIIMAWFEGPRETSNALEWIERAEMRKSYNRMVPTINHNRGRPYLSARNR